MMSAERSHVLDVNSSDEDSDDDSMPLFATDEQIMMSYYEVTAANPRKDGKIPWIKITKFKAQEFKASDQAQDDEVSQYAHGHEHSGKKYET